MCEPGLENSGLFSTSAGHTCSVQPWTCSTAWTGLEWALSQGLGAAVTTQDPTAPLPPPREQLPSGEQAFQGVWDFYGLTEVMGIPSPVQSSERLGRAVLELPKELDSGWTLL